MYIYIYMCIYIYICKAVYPQTIINSRRDVGIYTWFIKGTWVLSTLTAGLMEA